MIELEKRGYLTVEFKRWLDENARLIDRYHQMNIFCENTADSAVVFGDKKYTMSIVLSRRESGLSGLVKMKKGDMGAASRQEYQFDFDPNDADSLLGILETLGIIGYCPRYYLRTDYQWGDFEISVKENGLLADHFEVELTVGEENMVADGLKKMEGFFDERGLKIFTKEEYEKVLRQIFEDNPPVKWGEIDMGMILNQNTKN